MRRDHGRARDCREFINEYSGTAHQARSCTVADFSFYRATSHDLGVDVREIILVVTAQSTRIRHVNLVRRFAVLDDPNTTGLTDPQDRHETLSDYVRPAKAKFTNITILAEKRDFICRLHVTTENVYFT